MGANDMWAKIIGIVLLIVGIVGFFTGGNLVGFNVNALHNVIHVVTGALFVYAGFASKGKQAPMYNKTLGIIYLLVAVIGFLGISAFNDLLAINTADNWLHLVIAAISIIVGFWSK